MILINNKIKITIVEIMIILITEKNIKMQKIMMMFQKLQMKKKKMITKKIGNNNILEIIIIFR